MTTEAAAPDPDKREKAANIAFDLSKQFLSIAFAGIAFAIGLSAATANEQPSWLLWTTVGLFGLSSVLGLLFLMRGAGCVANDGSFDIYEPLALRLAGLQIATVAFGVAFLLWLHISTRRGVESVQSDTLRIEWNGNVIIRNGPSQLEIAIDPEGTLELRENCPKQPETDGLEQK